MCQELEIKGLNDPKNSLCTHLKDQEDMVPPFNELLS